MNNTCRYSTRKRFSNLGEGGGFIGGVNGYGWHVKIHEGSAVGFELRDPHNPGPYMGALFIYEFKKPCKLSYEEIGIVHSRLQGLVTILSEKITDFEYQLDYFVKAYKNTQL